MHAEPPLHPLRYSPEVERLDPDGQTTLSGVAPESHVLLNAILIVEPDLPAALRQGMFAAEARYPVIMRYAASSAAAAPHGLALKVYGVIGDRLPGAEGLTQDFVMAARPRDPRVINLDAAAETQILGDSFFGQTLIRFGDHVARIGIVPVSPGLTALTGRPLPAGRPTALRDSVVEFFANHRAEWELRVQLGADIEDKSPDLTVARIRAEPQRAWIQNPAEPGDDALSFSPWHGLIAHRPLGSTMHVGKAVRDASANIRLDRNHFVAPEPRSFSPLAED